MRNSERETFESAYFTDEDIKRAEAIASTVGIPPKPKIVTEIQSELNKENPDFSKISSLVERDVSLSAKILKVANSPFFSRGKIDSIQHALHILGMKTFNAILLSSALRDAVRGEIELIENFLNHSAVTATVAAMIARVVKEIPDHTAYITGLFHDCGIVLMHKKFNNYAKYFDYALYTLPVQDITDKFDSIVGLEQELFYTNHCVMGYVMAKSWGLSETILKAIINHHSFKVELIKDKTERILCSILSLADLVATSKYTDSKNFNLLLTHWIERNSSAMRELGLTNHDVDLLLTEASKLESE